MDIEEKNCCNTEIYIKIPKIMRSILAPLTHGEELNQELEDITGEQYKEIITKYCPFCGKKR